MQLRSFFGKLSFIVSTIVAVTICSVFVSAIVLGWINDSLGSAVLGSTLTVYFVWTLYRWERRSLIVDRISDAQQHLLQNFRATPEIFPFDLSDIVGSPKPDMATQSLGRNIAPVALLLEASSTMPLRWHMLGVPPPLSIASEFVSENDAVRGGILAWCVAELKHSYPWPSVKVKSTEEGITSKPDIESTLIPEFLQWARNYEETMDWVEAAWLLYRDRIQRLLNEFVESDVAQNVSSLVFHNIKDVPMRISKFIELNLNNLELIREIQRHARHL